ncbi:MAG TPA: alpha/beta hydrolase [Rhodobacteraceae bacterium]|nr:alpha/beta hydrolase [Paracoccaceae bacterium]
MKPFITHDGLTLDYKIEGEGKPLLCLPGLTRDLYDFDELAGAMRGEAQVIRLTMRGRGRSGWAADYASYNIVQEARDAVEFMDFLGLEKATIVGTSRGGFNAMILAATAPERLAGVLLNDIGPALMQGGIGDIMDRIGKPPEAQSLAALVLGMKADMSADFPDLTEAKWETLARRWFKVSDGGVALNYDPGIGKAMHEQAQGEAPDLWGLFDLMAGVPLALLRGANSDLLSAETAAQMQRRRPDMIYSEVPNRGHIPFLDELESLSVIRKLLAFA